MQYLVMWHVHEAKELEDASNAQEVVAVVDQILKPGTTQREKERERGRERERSRERERERERD